MIIAIGKSRKDIRWHNTNVTWENVLDRLREPFRSYETVKEYKAMTKDEKSRVKDVGGFVGGTLLTGRRKAENVRSRSLVTLDLDQAEDDAWDNAAIFGWTCCCYSTHSHTPEAPRLRLVLPLDRDVTPEEYQAIARKVAEYVGIEQMDPTTYEPSRLMYWPSCPKDGEYFFQEQTGDTLSADEILSSYGMDDAWKDSRLWPTAKTEEIVRVKEIKHQGDPTEKPGMVGLFCRTFNIREAIDRFIPDAYTEGDGGRLTYTKGSTADGAVLYEDDTFLYSHHATDPCSGQLVNAFDLVRLHLFGDLDDKSEAQEVTKLPSYKKMLDLAGSDEIVKKAAVRERMAEAEESFADLVGPDAAEAETTGTGEQETASDVWKAELTLDEKTGDIEPTIHNACVLLRNLPQFKDKLGYNPMSDVITVKGRLPWWEAQKKDQLEEMFSDDELRETDPKLRKLTGEGEYPWTENDWPSFYAFFEPLGFKTTGAHNGILDNALQIVSQEHSYHPIRSYLHALEWDGRPRLDDMFIRWLGAEDTQLNREITRLWMIAGVDRVMRPGCQFDSILITCGPQGIGKSRMLRMLARGFFTNSLESLTVGKQTGEMLQGMWIVELGELDGMKRGEMTAVKNFVTTTEDRFRGAYARTAVSHKRQCILAGTSNEGSFLRDDTGERRFWVMPVTGTGDNGEMVGFRDEVDQLWAEAVVRWKDRMIQFRAPGQRLSDVELCLYLKDPKLREQMEWRQQSYKLPEEDRDEVAGYLKMLRPVNWYSLSSGERRQFAQGDWLGDPAQNTLEIDRISVKELRCELFGERPEDTGRKSSMSMRLVSIMDSMPGWKKGKQGSDRAYGPGRRVYWYREDA